MVLREDWLNQHITTFLLDMAVKFRQGSRSGEIAQALTYQLSQVPCHNPLIRHGIGHWTLDKTTAMQYFMQDEEFEWDDDKAALNWRNHGISFEMAREAFKDVFAVAWVDDRHGDQEERFNVLGVVESRLLHVTYTLRNDRTRIISARKAEPHERRRYHNENEA